MWFEYSLCPPKYHENPITLDYAPVFCFFSIIAKDNSDETVRSAGFAIHSTFYKSFLEQP